jgi:hypothetical protein
MRIQKGEKQPKKEEKLNQKTSIKYENYWYRYFINQLPLGP